MIELCGTASSYFADAKRAVRTWPGLANWGQSLLILAAFVVATLTINKVEPLFKFAVTDDLQALLAIAAVAFFIPALAEELIFRVGLAGRKGGVRAALAIAAFVLWHPLQVWLGLPMAQDLFLNPGFLAITAALGLACTMAYRTGGSIWPAVLIHWLVVVGWKGVTAPV
ncbi:CPBP family glutamic-type intramembrane protease [uncultured Maricaulis sp.]|uniref:CPBP family glutamic-type intramembrane protease n=1 Tax=uncultured Maricaulis sp. TaxID=174710 RepID=UPI002638C5E2|nr:CPBP family glutamic-type intramembrane protease [uncultured Maricaulis sp.]